MNESIKELAKKLHFAMRKEGIKTATISFGEIGSPTHSLEVRLL